MISLMSGIHSGEVHPCRWLRNIFPVRSVSPGPWYEVVLIIFVVNLISCQCHPLPQQVVEHHSSFHQISDVIYLLFQCSQQAPEPVGQECILHHSSPPCDPVVADPLFICHPSSTVWLHHVALQGKNIVFQDEVGNIRLIISRERAWWGQSYGLIF